MTSNFASRGGGPGFISGDPQKDAPVGATLGVGLEHRAFSDEEIKQAFDAFDLDKNRFVGATEIKHILDIIGEEVTDEEIDEMIRMCDTDGDGQVTFDEFNKLMTEPPPPLPPPPVPKLKAKNRAAVQRRYGSGTKDLEEPAGEVVKSATLQTRSISVEAMIKKLAGGLDKIKPSQIKKVYQRFQEIDEDGNGKIDYDEWCKALEMPDTAATRQMFNVFNRDGNDGIELKEFIVMLSRYTAAAKSEKLKFAFMMFDEDGSGYIERPELLDMLAASFVVEGYSREELEERADAVFDFLGISRQSAISYENFLKLAQAKQGLVYPLQEEKRHLGAAMDAPAPAQEEAPAS